MTTRRALSKMPKVVDYLRLMRDYGPSLAASQRTRNSARDHGFSDYWVRLNDTDETMLLQDAVARLGEGYYKSITYVGALQGITPAGLEALAKWEEKQ